MGGQAKISKKTKVVILTLPPDVLAQFPADESTPSSDTPDLKRSQQGTNPDISVDDRSESNATPAPINGDGAQSQTQEDKKKKPTATGKKRAPPAIDPGAPAKERARPGPKKKAKLSDGADDRGDSNKQGAAANANSGIPAHKLGPRANTGAINAGLRALDRSGKPCRRWEKKGLQLKSFTGTVWNMSSWKGSHRPNLDANGEVQSDSSSDVKPDTSVVASEKSANGGITNGNDVLDIAPVNGLESSPAPAIAVS